MELPRSIRDTAELLRSRRASAVELAEAALARAHADRHNAWLHLCDEHARTQAGAAGAVLKSGGAPGFTGLPWAWKDIIGAKGVPTSPGSRHLLQYGSPYSATVVEGP